MSRPAILGLDIGGANLKADHLAGVTRSVVFELWRRPDDLAARLSDLFARMPRFDLVALTMTAELCDCFETKREGVARVLAEVERAVAGLGAIIRVWQTDGRFVDPVTARRRPLQTAASNWMALARWAGRSAARGPALLIDVGSTTTDLIPLHDGRPAPTGRTDPGRLASGELVYSGARRTPVCAVVQSVPYRGRPCPVAAEWFATTLDVYVTLGDLAEDPGDHHTADRRPATKVRALDRLARVIGADRECFDAAAAAAMARAVADAQLAQLARAADQVRGRLGTPPETLILAGSGEFLARRLATRIVAQAPWVPGTVGGTPAPQRLISLAEQLGRERSAAACAHAVAVLAARDPSHGW